MNPDPAKNLNPDPDPDPGKFFSPTKNLLEIEERKKFCPQNHQKKLKPRILELKFSRQVRRLEISSFKTNGYKPYLYFVF